MAAAAGEARAAAGSMLAMVSRAACVGMAATPGVAVFVVNGCRAACLCDISAHVLFWSWFSMCACCARECGNDRPTQATMSYAYLFKYIIIGDTGRCTMQGAPWRIGQADQCLASKPSRRRGEVMPLASVHRQALPAGTRPHHRG